MEAPLGIGAEALNDLLVRTRHFKQTHGGEGGDLGPDNDFASRMMENLGAWV